MGKVRTSKVTASQPAPWRRWTAGAMALVPAPRHEHRQREGSPRRGWRCTLARWRVHRALEGGPADGGEQGEQLRLSADAPHGCQTSRATAGGGGRRCKWRTEGGQSEHIGHGPGVMARKRSTCSMTSYAMGLAAA